MPDDQKPGHQPEKPSDLKPEDRLKPADVYDPNRSEEDEEHARKMAELFGDLDDDDAEETIDEAREDRDALRAQVDRLKASVARTRKENSALLQQVNDGKQAIAGIDALRAQDRKEAAKAFLTELKPGAEELVEALKEIDADERAANPKLDKLTVGVESTVKQLTDVFNKYGVKQDASPAAPSKDDAPKAEPPADDDDIVLQDDAPQTPEENRGEEKEQPVTVETIETIHAERDALLAESSQLSSTVAKAQADNLTLTRRIDEGKQILAREEAKREEDKKYAIEKPLKDLMPVIDTLEMGLSIINKKSRAEDPNLEYLAKSVENTLGDVTKVFNKHSIVQINPVDEAFDEENHEAVSMMAKPGAEPGTVVGVVQKGYKLHDRNVRHARVVVTPFD